MTVGDMDHNDSKEQMEYTDEFQRQSEAFLAWLRRSGANINPAIALQDLRQKAAGRGIVALEDIPPDTPLFSIPRPMILCTANSAIVRDLPDVFSDMDPWLSLILAMIYEFNRGSASPWSAYFQVLPSHFDTLMFWTQEELNELQASAVVKKVGKSTADEKFRTELVPVVKKYWHIFGTEPEKQPNEDEILSLAHRMGSTIMAYAFDIEDDRPREVDDDGYVSEEEDESLPKGMVPMADMLNADADRNNARLFYEPDILVMKSLSEIRAGEEIFNDYGPLPTSDLLRRYGYTTANYRQYDVVELPLELIIRCSKLECGLSDGDIESKLEYLDEHGALEDGYDLCRPSFGEPASFMSDELFVLMTIFVLSPDDFAQLRHKGRLPKPSLSTQVSKILIAAVRNRQREYITSLEQDRELEAAGGQLGRKALALQVRIGEKEILSDALRLLEASTENLPMTPNGEENQARKRRKLQ